MIGIAAPLKPATHSTATPTRKTRRPSPKAPRPVQPPFDAPLTPPRARPQAFPVQSPRIPGMPELRPHIAACAGVFRCECGSSVEAGPPCPWAWAAEHFGGQCEVPRG